MEKVSNNLIDIESPKFQESQLQFQEFPQDTTSAAKNSSEFEPVLPTTSSVDLADPSEDTRSKYGMFSIEYYQQLFDVTTDQVLDRMLWSMIPRRRKNYRQHHIGNKPDLYGPFWICVTLVFTVAISGNLANYLRSSVTHSYHWRYDFHAVTLAATAIFSYAWLLPVVLWTILRWQSTDKNTIGLLDLLCIYGYSLSIFIPISILWLIQIIWLQWLLALVGAADSGSILVSGIWPSKRDISILLIVAILGFHLILVLYFMMNFFHVPDLTLENVFPVFPGQPTVVNQVANLTN